MGKQLTWGDAGTRMYETGVSKGVLFPAINGVYQKGVAWNGLTAVTLSPSGADLTEFWADNGKYASMRAAEAFAATIEAYMSPPEFDACDGSVEVAPGMTIGQQARQAFGFSYRNEEGNDLNPEAGYTIHLIFNCTAAPSERAHNSINDSPDAATMSWEAASTPVAVPGYKNSSHFEFSSLRASEGKMAALEAILYGTETTDPRMPTPAELITLMTPAGG